MRTIPLTKGKVALVDDEDYEFLAQFNWTTFECRNTSYAFRSIRRPGKPRRSIQMHRVIVGLEDGDDRVIDHIDNNGLNNQRSNLRIVTNHQNTCRFFRKPGKSGYRGVCWIARIQKWQASIRHMGRQRTIGQFKTAEEAAEAYDREVVRLRGEFGVTNKMLKTVI